MHFLIGFFIDIIKNSFSKPINDSRAEAQRECDALVAAIKRVQTFEAVAILTDRVWDFEIRFTPLIDRELLNNLTGKMYHEISKRDKEFKTEMAASYDKFLGLMVMDEVNG